MVRALRFSALWLIALAATAADFGALKPQGYVSDFAKVLDAATVRQLNEYITRVEQSTGAELAIVTLPSLEGEPVEDVANLLYRKWGIGKKGQDTGALFLLSIGDRKSRLEVGYGLEPILPDGAAGEMLREMRPALRAGDYRSALATATAELGERIAREKGVAIAGSPRPRRRPQGREFGLGPIVSLVIFLAVMWMLGSGRRGSRGRRLPGARGSDVLTGILLGQILNQGRSRGGGGFGGYDSGDSWGGFGGGSSGGGGASSDW